MWVVVRCHPHLHWLSSHISVFCILLLQWPQRRPYLFSRLHCQRCAAARPWQAAQLSRGLFSIGGLLYVCFSFFLKSTTCVSSFSSACGVAGEAAAPLLPKPQHHVSYEHGYSSGCLSLAHVHHPQHPRRSTHMATALIVSDGRTQLSQATPVL